MWNDAPVKDYDIFCTNKKSADKLSNFFKTYTGLQTFTTENAITFGEYQFVMRDIGRPEIEVAKFDFKHNCYYYNSTGLHAVYGWEYVNDNKLIFNDGRARNILNIMTRIPKFVARGMTITQSEMLKILEAGTRANRIYGERKYIKSRIEGSDGY